MPQVDLRSPRVVVEEGRVTGWTSVTSVAGNGGTNLGPYGFPGHYDPPKTVEGSVLDVQANDVLVGLWYDYEGTIIPSDALLKHPPANVQLMHSGIGRNQTPLQRVYHFLEAGQVIVCPTGASPAYHYVWAKVIRPTFATEQAVLDVAAEKDMKARQILAQTPPRLKLLGASIEHQLPQDHPFPDGLDVQVGDLVTHQYPEDIEENYLAQMGGDATYDVFHVDCAGSVADTQIWILAITGAGSLTGPEFHLSTSTSHFLWLRMMPPTTVYAIE